MAAQYAQQLQQQADLINRMLGTPVRASVVAAPPPKPLIDRLYESVRAAIVADGPVTLATAARIVLLGLTQAAVLGVAKESERRRLAMVITTRLLLDLIPKEQEDREEILRAHRLLTPAILKTYTILLRPKSTGCCCW
jgi:hypothetical protein